FDTTQSMSEVSDRFLGQVCLPKRVVHREQGSLSMACNLTLVVPGWCPRNDRAGKKRDKRLKGFERCASSIVSN
ncbi:MAG TPA: hypothetical protein VN039_15065, partial [Nitrospira sp.]|nr:hypothetical protein [Nitrospira sp.]